MDKKNSPTPKRRDQLKRKPGPVPPAPLTRKAAKNRAKIVKPALTKIEKKRLKAEQKELRIERRKLMRAGEEKYLLPKDKGPVKKLARDYIDAKRNIGGLTLPLLILLMSSFVWGYKAQFLISLIAVIWLVLSFGEAILNAKNITQIAIKRFPKEKIPNLIFYCFSRSILLRSQRLPAPQVKVGDKI